MDGTKKLYLFLTLISGAIFLFSPQVEAVDRPQVNLETSQETINLPVNGNRVLNIVVKNPLPNNDNITLTAKEKVGHTTDFSFIEESGIYCNSNQKKCNVSLNSNSERTVKLRLTGNVVGETKISIEGQSVRTGLNPIKSPNLNVYTQMTQGDAFLSSPGIQTTQLLTLVFLSSLIFLLVRKK